MVRINISQTAKSNMLTVILPMTISRRSMVNRRMGLFPS